MLKALGALAGTGAILSMSTGWVGLVLIAGVFIFFAGELVAPYPMAIQVVAFLGAAATWGLPALVAIVGIQDFPAASRGGAFSAATAFAGWLFGTLFWILIVGGIVSLIISVAFSLFHGSACEYENPAFGIAVTRQPFFMVTGMLSSLDGPSGVESHAQTVVEMTSCGD